MDKHQGIPERFKCESIAYSQYIMLERLVRVTAEVSRNKTARRVILLVTDRQEDLDANKSKYVASMVKSHSLRGVCWSSKNIDAGAQLWFNPEYAEDTYQQEYTMTHELSHAFCATATSHDESFRKLLHRSWYHYLMLTGEGSVGELADKALHEGCATVRRYTVQCKDNYLEDRFGYESDEDYTQRIAAEACKAQTMAEKEHEKVVSILHERFPGEYIAIPNQ